MPASTAPATKFDRVRMLLQQMWRRIATRYAPGNAWTVSLGPDMFLDFCVWVLECDGLRASPFEHHPDGDGSLRAAGLTAEAWRAWFDRVVAVVAAFGATLPRNDDAWPPFPDPVALWDGAPAVGTRLAELDADYDLVAGERKEASAHLWWPGRPDADESTQLWETLAPYQRRLPPLTVVYVAYPGPARLVVPPATVVLAAAGWQPGPGGLTAAVLAGAAELAGDDRPSRP
jgi:hypothetical protein